MLTKNVNVESMSCDMLSLQPRELRRSGRAFLHSLFDSQHQVQEPVELHRPAFISANLDLVQEVTLGLLLRAADGQRLSDVLNVLFAGQLGHTGHQHHGEENDEQVGVVSQS